MAILFPKLAIVPSVMLANHGQYMVNATVAICLYYTRCCPVQLLTICWPTTIARSLYFPQYMSSATFDHMLADITFERSLLFTACIVSSVTVYYMLSRLYDSVKRHVTYRRINERAPNKPTERSRCDISEWVKLVGTESTTINNRA